MLLGFDTRFHIPEYHLPIPSVMGSDTKDAVDVNVRGSRPLSSSSIVQSEKSESTPKTAETLFQDEIESDSESDAEPEAEPEAESKTEPDSRQSHLTADATEDSDSGFESTAEEEPRGSETPDTEEDSKIEPAKELGAVAEDTKTLETVDTADAAETEHRLSKQEVVEENIPIEDAGQDTSITADAQTETETETETGLGTQKEVEVETEATEESEAETPTMAHDSMVTVRLSEPPALKLDTDFDSGDAASRHKDAITNRDTIDSKTTADSSMPRISTATLSPADPNRSLQDELGQVGADGHDSDGSEDLEEVNWEELEKTEDEQSKEDEADNVGC